jgi:4-hydroxythreonine-4-phosphate dehydrogenase
LAASTARRSLRRSEDVGILPRIVITSGEPAGIGPDICVKLAQRDWRADIVVAGNAALLASTATTLGLPLRIESYQPHDPLRAHRAGTLKVLDLELAAPVRAGTLDVRNAPYVIAMLDRACDGCTNGEFAAMVTAPVQKSILLEAGYPFPGHTEYLAARTRAALPVMMLTSSSMRVALVTTHLPLAAVPAAITPVRLTRTLRIVHADLGRHFGIAHPRIAVLGLNPHAGEAGHLGREEIEVIAPVLDALRAEHIDVRGPVPADTAFTPSFLADVDAVVAMYHDQGLPALKATGFGHTVNITLGLPILRVSVDHGTALTLARTGQADEGSLGAALELALELLADTAAARPNADP